MKTSFKFINEQGKRINNEDSLLASPEQGLYLVCDGVGGSNKGEVASKLACDTVQQYLLQHAGGAAGAADINAAVATTEEAFDDYVEDHPESNGMATTLTLVQLHSGGATLAHVGDSRIYQVRNGQILYKTKDHSLVNELVASGHIDEEEAKSHPQKNVITRAVQGTKRPAVADVAFITEIEHNDYFFLCTDGILESIDDGYVRGAFTATADIGQIKADIERLCEQNSRDNFSAIILKIEKGIEGEKVGVPAGAVIENNEPATVVTATQKKAVGKGKTKPLLIAGIFIIIIAVCTYLFFNRQPITNIIKYIKGNSK